MKIFEELTEDQMIGAFLKGEIDSERFGSEMKKEINTLGIRVNVVINPDTSDAQQNELRRKIFSRYRGYGDNQKLFEKFPTNIKWMRARLHKNELLKVRYIDYDYWIELSSGSRLPIDAANNIRKGIEVFKISNERFLKTAQSLRDGEIFPELILVGKDDKSYMVILEGHLRLTAYALAPEHIPELTPVIVGFSPSIEQWPEY